jgi:nucleobase:cation symporter-1, NCS1 family
MTAAATAVESSALAGRMPVRSSERTYETYGTFLRTFATIGSALWVFLIGSALPAVGDTRIAIIGYACGLVLGFIPVVLSAGLPSFRYGIDSIDASKAALGRRGALLPLVGTIVNAIGWAGVVMSMIARGTALLISQAHTVPGVSQEHTTVGLSLVTIVACSLLLRGGLKYIQRLNDFVGPALIVLATGSLILLGWRFGVRHLWNTNVEPGVALTADRRKSLAYAVEFGIASSMSWWPYVGGLYRLLKHRHHAVGPSIIGGTLIGGAYCSGIAALAAVSLGTADPVVWIIALAGKTFGTAIVLLLLLMNIPTICMLIYFAAVSVQQIRALARLPWNGLVTLLLIPLMLVSFYTEWTITHIMTIATYCGVQFIGLAAIQIVDFYVLRGQSIALDQIFSSNTKSDYSFWHEVNPVAIGVIAISIATYLSLYDPVTLAAPFAFRYLGAGIPVFLSSGILYYFLTRVIAIRAGRGGYPTRSSGSAAAKMDVEVAL